MNILFVCDVLGEENNGTTIAALNIIRYLKSKGHTVKVLCCDEDKKNMEGYYVLPKLNAGPFNGYVAKNGISLAWNDKKVIEEAFKGIDICHIMMPLFLGKACAKYAHKRGITLTAGFHTQAENVSNHFFLMDAKKANLFLYKNFYKKVYRYCDGIHYPTQFIQDTFEKIVGKTPGYVISNGVKGNFVHIENVPRPDSIKDKFIVLSTGRLSKEKAQSILLEAVKLSKYKDKIQVILAGDGPLKEKLKEIGDTLPNKPVIQFFSHDEIVKIINIADLYVHPAEVEIESISCLEAITCGVVPVIANSDRSATKYFALDENNLFINKDCLDLAHKIDFWIENPQLKEEYSKRYMGFTKKFNFDECMEKMENMFLEVINKKKELK
ncbi:MAG: glycosyltransferase [Bacilli bacterium]